MAIEFTCPTCAGVLRVGDAAGRKVRCGQCLTVLDVPEPPVSPALPVAADEPPFERNEPEADGPWPPEYDPPTRRPARRRRPPAPPPGRGPLVWVAVVLGVCFLGACACCGGGFLLLPGENWRRHQSPEGGFAVDLPAAVKSDMPIPGMKPDPAMKVEGTVLWKRGEFYAVIRTEILPTDLRAATDQALLDEVVRDMESDPEIKRLVRKDRATVSGFPALEVEYLYEDGGTYVGRVVVADRRLYVLVAGGRFVRPGNANARRFLDSFEVTDPRLRGGIR